jgi:glycosyltransferase involved in cell wall biosynthesis
MKFAFGTVIFPKVLKFFPEFIQSLCNQTDKNFHLFIVNDGCKNKQIGISGLEYTILPPGKTIAQNREILINEVYNQKYDWIIFGDSDDYFDNNRIEIIREFTKDYDLISNEIVPFAGLKVYEPQFLKVLGDFSEIDLTFIRDKNLFGLSNVACRTKYMINITIPSEIIAIDWYLFTKAIQSGAKACFTAKTKTYYRQWDNNIIGVDKRTIEQIKTGVKAKYFHYKNMVISDPWFESELVWLQSLYNQIDNISFNNYIQKVKKTKEDFTFWWESIKNYGDE